MENLLKKLNIKDQQSLTVINAPNDILAQIQATLPPFLTLKTKAAQNEAAVIFFCTQKKEVDQYAAKIVPLLQPDALFWMAYPKGSSKKYKCDFNRDNGWTKLAELGFEPVRQIAIDEDWSALRFRNPDFIKTMTRGFAATEKGKEKVKAAKKG